MTTIQSVLNNPVALQIFHFYFIVPLLGKDRMTIDAPNNDNYVYTESYELTIQKK